MNHGKLAYFLQKDVMEGLAGKPSCSDFLSVIA